MRILFLTPTLPWPLLSGGQIRAYHLLKALQKHHTVTLVSYIRQNKEEQYIGELEKICQQIHLIKRQYKPWTPRALLKTLFSTKPLVMNIYQTSEPSFNNIKDYDAIYCECFYLMDKIPGSSLPIFLSEQNIEYLAYQRYIDALPLWKKIILWLPMQIDVLKMKFWETRMWQKAERVAVMSETDKKIIEKETGRTDVVVIPNGVDTDSFKIREKISVTGTILFAEKLCLFEEKLCLFVGNFSWFQNLQAVEWLVKEIFPAIKEKLAGVKLLVVGLHAPAWLKNYRSQGVTVDETVKDIRRAYQKAAVLLAPLKSGGGTKYKILEAMASGIPVVTTPVGQEGFSEDCMIVGNNSEDLAGATVDIISNPENYTDMVKRARNLVEENYDWKIIGEKLENFLKTKNQDLPKNQRSPKFV